MVWLLTLPYLPLIEVKWYLVLISWSFPAPILSFHRNYSQSLSVDRSTFLLLPGFVRAIWCLAPHQLFGYLKMLHRATPYRVGIPISDQNSLAAILVNSSCSKWLSQRLLTSPCLTPLIFPSHKDLFRAVMESVAVSLLKNSIILRQIYCNMVFSLLQYILWISVYPFISLSAHKACKPICFFTSNSSLFFNHL